MKIKLSPQRRERPITAFVSGDVITVSGVAFDFSRLKEGDVLPSSAVGDMFFGDIVRDESGEICLTLVLPHGAKAPKETKFPVTYDVAMTVEGEVALPDYDEVTA